jgi:hypothetical protein
VLVVLAVFGLALLWTYIVDNGQTPQYTYSDMLMAAKNGNIKSISMMPIANSASRIMGSANK